MVRCCWWSGLLQRPLALLVWSKLHCHSTRHFPGICCAVMHAAEACRPSAGSLQSLPAHLCLQCWEALLIIEATRRPAAGGTWQHNMLCLQIRLRLLSSIPAVQRGSAAEAEQEPGGCQPTRKPINRLAHACCSEKLVQLKQSGRASCCRRQQGRRLLHACAGRQCC